MQALRALIVLAPDDRHVSGFDGEFIVGEKYAGQRTRQLGGSARQIAHRLRCLLAMGVTAEIATEKIHEAGDLDLVVNQLCRLCEYANSCFRCLRGQEASRLIPE